MRAGMREILARAVPKNRRASLDRTAESLP